MIRIATGRGECLICSAETRDRHDEFCPACERRLEIAIHHQAAADGPAVLVPLRVN